LLLLSKPFTFPKEYFIPSTALDHGCHGSSDVAAAIGSNQQHTDSPAGATCQMTDDLLPTQSLSAKHGPATNMICLLTTNV
jgi:hypothetical protein